MDYFTRREVLGILESTVNQLAYWERIGLVSPQKGWQGKLYRFSDLITLRTVKDLTAQRVSAQRLRRVLDALKQQLTGVETPLTELRILSDGRQLVVEHQGARLEPFSGQRLLNFETGPLSRKVHKMPERTAEEWFGLALACEGDPATRPQAIDAYQHVVEKRPDWVEPHINLGTLLYEQGKREEAVRCYRQALRLEPANALAHFNLGTVLDDLGTLAGAREHLERAAALKPDYADAHYNLAVLLEKIGAREAARRHWQRYLALDRRGPWADYARERLGSDAG